MSLSFKVENVDISAIRDRAMFNTFALNKSYVIKGIGNQLSVTSSTSSFEVTLNSGEAVIYGGSTLCEGTETITLSRNETGYLVIRVDLAQTGDNVCQFKAVSTLVQQNINDGSHYIYDLPLYQYTTNGSGVSNLTDVRVITNSPATDDINNVKSTYVKKSGDIMSGSLRISGTGDRYVRTSNDNGDVSFTVSSAGNKGIYDNGLGKWLFKANPAGTRIDVGSANETVYIGGENLNNATLKGVVKDLGSNYTMNYADFDKYGIYKVSSFSNASSPSFAYTGSDTGDYYLLRLYSGSTSYNGFLCYSPRSTGGLPTLFVGNFWGQEFAGWKRIPTEIETYYKRTIDVDFNDTSLIPSQVGATYKHRIEVSSASLNLHQPALGTFSWVVDTTRVSSNHTLQTANRGNNIICIRSKYNSTWSDWQNITPTEEAFKTKVFSLQRTLPQDATYNFTASSIGYAPTIDGYQALSVIGIYPTNSSSRVTWTNVNNSKLATARNIYELSTISGDTVVGTATNTGTSSATATLRIDVLYRKL